jgi:hypothetical protein
MLLRLTSFGSAGGEALQGHLKVFAILHKGAKRAILTRVKVVGFPMNSPCSGNKDIGYQTFISNCHPASFYNNFSNYDQCMTINALFHKL